MRPFEVREGMEGEHPPETDLIRRHQDFEEGERLESFAAALLSLRQSVFLQAG